VSWYKNPGPPWNHTWSHLCRHWQLLKAFEDATLTTKPSLDTSKPLKTNSQWLISNRYTSTRYTDVSFGLLAGDLLQYESATRLLSGLFRKCTPLAHWRYNKLIAVHCCCYCLGWYIWCIVLNSKLPTFNTIPTSDRSSTVVYAHHILWRNLNAKECCDISLSWRCSCSFDGVGQCYLLCE
jgi:hypothetical protein